MIPTAIPSTSYLPFFWFNPRFPDCLGRPFNLQAPYATVASATKKGSGIATRYLSIEMIESSNSWFTWWNVREKPFHANTPVGKYSSVAVSPPLSTHLNMFPQLIHLRFSGRQSPIGTARHDKQRTPQCVGVSHIDHSMTGRTHSQNQDGQVSENAQVLKIPKYCNLRKTETVHNEDIWISKVRWSCSWWWYIYWYIYLDSSVCFQMSKDLLWVPHRPLALEAIGGFCGFGWKAAWSRWPIDLGQAPKAATTW